MKRPKIGLALGSGGARGFAHIGVLKVLQEHQIPIDYIAGSSMGSVVGTFFANGLDIELLTKLAVHLKRNLLIDYTVPKMGFVKGERIKELITLLTHGKYFEDLHIPTAVVATDLISGERVVFNSGPIDQAVRASISIPGIFEPVKIGDRLLVDGGVVDRVPAGLVREMGADLVIAIDVSPKKLNTQISSVLDVITQSIDIMEREILKYHAVEADVIIRPNVNHYGTLEFEEVESIIKEGEESIHLFLPKIKQMIQDWEETYVEKS